MKTSCRHAPGNPLCSNRYLSVTVVAHTGDPDRSADQIRETLTRRGCGLYPLCGVPGEIPSLNFIERNPGKSVIMQWLFAVISGLITGEGAHAR